MKIHNDAQGIELALQWAAKGLFSTTPNPRVGCVSVKSYRVIDEGYTLPAGPVHAEVQALTDAATRGCDVRGATVYGHRHLPSFKRVISKKQVMTNR